MAKILFVSDNFLNEGLGIMYLSSYLKANGHEVDLTLLQDFNRFDKLIDYIEAADPDLVGFSVMTPQVEQFRPVSKLIKEKTTRKVIWGGPHCMFMQEDVMKYGCTDIICMGDGEEALLTLMDRIEAGEDYSDVNSLLVKTEKGWMRNSLLPPEENLDKYPFPDRSLYYDKYPLMANFAVKRFITTRGCPYKCAYCFEPTYFDMYKGKGKVFRRHSIEYALEEVERVLEKYPTRRVHFCDDIFNLDKNWVKEFSKRYKKQFNLDWSCNIEVTSLDEEIIEAMVDGRCRGGTFGLECGVEETRINMLNKKITNARYVEVTDLLKKHKFKFIMNIMFCLPNESLEAAIESVRFGSSLKPYGIRVSILKMYKGTELANYAIRNDLSEGTGEFTYKAKDIHGDFDKIANMNWAATMFGRFPFCLRFAKNILSSRWAKILMPLQYLNHWEDIRFFDIPFWQSLQYFWSSRDVFIGGMAKGQTDIYRDEEGVEYSAKEVFAKPTGLIDWNAEWKKGDTYDQPENRPGS
ncbi:MAG: B12-binding domain-containing radical SAM protein [Rhodospirillales bacterium]|nr:B12-binding domain-containing radical SAM protein [Rhodospirillales bacterium]